MIAKRIGPGIVTCALFSTAMYAQDGRWKGFYSQDVLLYWSQQMPRGVRENLDEVILPALLPAERARLVDVRLDFPLENAEHIMNFYSDLGERRVVMPVSSMRFFADMALAYTWLNVKRCSLDPVSDYLVMLKYQWPQGLGAGEHLPLEVLGIPRDAREDADVAPIFQTTLNTGLVFILAHELGHLYYRHADDPPKDVTESREHEKQADEFALELMRRIGAPPVGIAIVFNVWAHLQPMPGDPGYMSARAERTHPLNGDRLRVSADFMERNLDSYTRGMSNAAAIHALLRNVAVQLRTLGAIDDPDVQGLLRSKGLAARPNELGPRRLDELYATRTAAPPPSQLPFDGEYVGYWRTEQGGEFAGVMRFQRAGKAVSARFIFAVAGEEASRQTQPTISSGVDLVGVLDGDACYFDWRWGSDFFGRGVLLHDPDGTRVMGTWGYNDGRDGGGTWVLDR